MMISSAAANPYAAAAALDRALRAGGAGPDDGAPDAPDAGPPDGGPDVVLSLSSGGPPPSSGTYDASGRMGGSPSLAQLGANGPHSMAHASESADDGGGDDGDDDASVSAAPTGSPDAASSDARVDEDIATPA